jgi:hypothetical protein
VWCFEGSRIGGSCSGIGPRADGRTNDVAEFQRLNPNAVRWSHHDKSQGSFSVVRSDHFAEIL